MFNFCYEFSILFGKRKGDEKSDFLFENQLAKYNLSITLRSQ